MNPNFEEYSLIELEEVKEQIDKDLYPERYKTVCDLITKIKTGAHTPQAKPIPEIVLSSNKPIRNVDSEGNYIPNSIPKQEIKENIIISFFLIAYAIYGTISGEMYLPVSKRESVFVYGTGIWVANGAFICGCLYLLSYVVDHYDKRDNEIYYYEFRRWVKYTGYLLMFLAFIFAISS